jgi:hypothetical protein
LFTSLKGGVSAQILKVKSDSFFEVFLYFRTLLSPLILFAFRGESFFIEGLNLFLIKFALGFLGCLNFPSGLFFLLGDSLTGTLAFELGSSRQFFGCFA